MCDIFIRSSEVIPSTQRVERIDEGHSKLIATNIRGTRLIKKVDLTYTYIQVREGIRVERKKRCITYI